MRHEDCSEMRLLIQADVDGELTPAETARTEAHLGYCPDCAGLQTRILALGGRIRREVTPFEPPDGLLDTVRVRLAMIAPPPVVVPITAAADSISVPRRRWPGRAAPFGGGFALAACLAFVLLFPKGNSMADAVVSDHIRALQPGHLIDVVSTDQHTVKPWFDGRLDFAPPVKELKGVGFALEGGRLDYLDGKQAAALIYKRGQHIIELFVWPESGHPGSDITKGSLRGYNFVRWQADGMAFWAVSDLEADELADFTRMVRAN
jgi:anti-sigma factor RsiW